MSWRPVALACVLSLSFAPPALAEEPEDGQVRLPLARYAELLAAAQRASGARPSFSRGTVEVTLPGPDADDVTVSLSTQLSVRGTGEVVLLLADAVLEEATFSDSPAALVHAVGAYAMVVEEEGAEGALALRYRVPARTLSTGARYALVPLPALPGAALTVVAGAAAPTVEVTPAAGLTRAGGRINAKLPFTQTLVVRWGEAGADHVVRRVDYRLAPDASGEGADVDATYEVHVRARRAQVRLAPASVALTDVRDGAVPVAARVQDDWHVAAVNGTGRRVLKARFKLPVDRSHGQPQVTLYPDGVPITRFEAVIPGSRQVTLDPAVPVETTVRGAGRGAVTRAVAHVPPSEEFTARWTESRAAPEDRVRINSETYQLVTMQEGVIRSRAIVHYEVIRGEVEQLSVQLPEDVVLYKVSGAAIEDWRTFAAADDQPRQVRIQLGEPLEGEASVELQLETVAPREEGAAVAVPLVRPLGAFREMGVVALFDGKKVGFAEATSTGFAKAGQDALPLEVRKELTDKVRQAFKHVGPPGTLASRVAAAQERETRFDAHVHTLYTIKEGTLLGSATAMVEVKSGRRDAVVVSLPEGTSEPRITAPSLNKSEPAPDFDAGSGRKAWEVRFTQALEGAISIDVEFEQLLPKELGHIQVPDVRVEGAEVEDGSLGFAAETGIEVQPLEPKELRRLTVPELPKAIRLRSERDVVLGFSYAHPPWSLSLDVKRHRTVETLKGQVSAAWLETTVLDNGHVITRATYQVENEDRQYLRLKLPEGSQVLTVAAGGAKVKAVVDDSGAVAVPLPKGRTLAIDVAWEVVREKLGPVGRLALVAPHADLRVGALQWLLQVPDGTSLHAVSTDMKRVESWTYRAPETTGGAEALPEGDFERYLFTYAVHDPKEPPLEVSFVFVTTGAGALEALLLLLALALLSVVAHRRALREPLRGRDWVLLVAGVLLLVVKAGAFGLGVGGTLLAALVLVAVAVVGRRAREREEVAA